MLLEYFKFFHTIMCLTKFQMFLTLITAWWWYLLWPILDTILQPQHSRYPFYEIHQILRLCETRQSSPNWTTITNLFEYYSFTIWVNISMKFKTDMDKPKLRIYISTNYSGSPRLLFRFRRHQCLYLFLCQSKSIWSTIYFACKRKTDWNLAKIVLYFVYNWWEKWWGKCCCM